MVCALETTGIPALLRLVNRQAMLATLRNGYRGFARTEEATPIYSGLAVLLSDEGPSADLDNVLELLTTNISDRKRAATARLQQWARQRAAARDVYTPS
jgi:hypothetical protein